METFVKVIFLLTCQYSIISACEIPDCLSCTSKEECKQCNDGLYWDETEKECLGKIFLDLKLK